MQVRMAHRGFTLIELLVVVGIIAVVIGILIPSLKMARQASRTAACLANMRTIAVAAQNYEAQNRGYLYQSLPALIPARSSNGTPNPNSIVDRRLAICPAIADYLDVYSSAAQVSSTYSWNPWTVAIGTVLNSMFKPASTRNSSEVVLLADTMKTDANGMYLSGNEFADPFASQYSTGGCPPLVRPNFHGRHGGRGSVLWVDGHASTAPAIAIPTDTSVYIKDYRGLNNPPQYYNKNHIGYLAKSALDLNSAAAIYYFVSKKDALSATNINSYLKYYPSSGGYAVNPAAW